LLLKTERRGFAAVPVTTLRILLRMRSLLSDLVNAMS